MVYVKGGADLDPPFTTTVDNIDGTADVTSEVVELGLCVEPIRITPHFRHHDVYIDDFGPQIPPEVLWFLTDVTITMTLVHFDDEVLQTVINQTMGGSQGPGQLRSAGTPMGGGGPLFAPQNYYMSMSLQPAEPDDPEDPDSTTITPWTFPACYLYQQPLVFPLGTERSLVQLVWRAIPYVPLNPNFTQEELTPNLPAPPVTFAPPNEMVSTSSTIWTYDELESSVTTVSNID